MVEPSPLLDGAAAYTILVRLNTVDWPHCGKYAMSNLLCGWLCCFCRWSVCAVWFGGWQHHHLGLCHRHTYPCAPYGPRPRPHSRHGLEQLIPGSGSLQLQPLCTHTRAGLCSGPTTGGVEPSFSCSTAAGAGQGEETCVAEGISSSRALLLTLTSILVLHGPMAFVESDKHPRSPGRSCIRPAGQSRRWVPTLCCAGRCQMFKQHLRQTCTGPCAARCLTS
jgi:hypothetical protein